MALVAGVWAVLTCPDPTAVVYEVRVLGLLPGAGQH